MQAQVKDYWKLFKPSACSLRLQGSTGAEVFQELARNMIRAKLLPDELREPAVQAFLGR